MRKHLQSIKSIGSAIWSIVPIVGICAAALTHNVPLTLLWGFFLVVEAVDRAADRIVTAVRSDKVGAALISALRRQPRTTFRSGGDAA